MKVQVEHALPRLLADVGHHPVALQSQLRRQLGDHLEYMPHHSLIIRIDGGYRGDVHLGHYQKVGGRLGVNVIKGVAQGVLIHLVGRDLPGDDLAEQTVRHTITSS